jgi:hypothetical protein
MKITQTIFIALFFFVSCKKELSQQEKFTTFLNSIPDLKIPFQTNSGEELQAAFYPDTIYKDFIDDSSNGVYAKIKVNDSIHGIIFLMPGDILFPLLVTYNSAGKKLNELALVNLSGDGYNANGTSYVVMNKNLEIQMTDTVNTFERDTLNEEIIEASRKTEVIIEKYKIASDGKINRKDL